MSDPADERRSVVDKLEPLTVIHDATGGIDRCSGSLREIARALSRIGMSDLADEIGVIASDLRLLSGDVRRAYGRDLSGQLKRSQEATGNMLSAAIAVAVRKEG